MSIQSKLVQLGEWAEGAKQVVAGDFAGALVATGSTQATALALPADVNVFATTAASTGAILPLSGAAYITVLNGGVSALLVYPPVSGQINALAANAGFSVTAAKSAVFISSDGLVWVATLSA